MKNLPLSDSMLESLLTYLAGKDSFVFLETVRCTSEDHRTLLFLDQVDRLILRQGDSPLSFFRQAQSFMNKGYYLAGWFSYEFGYTLEPVLGRGDASDPDRILADLGIF
ncbi:MAG: aminodeoxychorismate synthase, component I, partial [Desulfobulbaceae bacterium]|nr:aminodeoxychorismate synthase, component I [Desulfobulbaceae bacterium]